MRLRASPKVNQSARSTSGNSCWWPEFGGHSIENVLLRIVLGEQLPSKAHTLITFPPACLMASSGMNSPSGWMLVSSSNSLFAASRGFSVSSYSPLGMDHAPSSFFLQKGPPGCTSNTCSCPSHFLNINSPALTALVMLAIARSLERFGMTTVSVRRIVLSSPFFVAVIRTLVRLHWF